jgi:hypothetical protein
MEQEDLPLFENLEVQESQPDPQANLEGFNRPFGKYIVYVDESGDHSIVSIDKRFPIFVLAFCIFHKGHYSKKVVPALEAFKFKHFGHDQVVLHEHEIRKEKGAFHIFPDRDARIRFLEELTNIVESSNFILASCVIDKQRLEEEAERPENLYHIALMHCILSLYDFLQEKGEHESLTHVVVECRGAKEDKELELEFRRICDGSNPRKRRLPFEILFSDKKAMSSGLQLADLVARPVGLNVLRPDQPNRAFDALKQKFFCEGGRTRTGENFDGWGLKIVPPIKSEGPR